MSRLSVDDALRLIADTTPLLPVEEVAPVDALGRIVAAEVLAPIDLPPFDNSAVDGYAVSAEDLAALPDGAGRGAPLSLALRGEVAAGSAAAARVRRGETVRVMTGGRLPEGAAAVVMREDVDEGASAAGGAGSAGASPPAGAVVVLVRRAVPAGANVRRRGEEIRAGEVALREGQRVNAGGMGFLIALGVGAVAVRRRPRVALLATGNELVPAGEPIRQGAVRDSSTPTLAALVASAGAIPVPLPIAPDDRALLAERVREGLRSDLLVTTGGVSVGDYDYVKEVLVELGVEIRFWRVAMKPGKPLVYGIRGDARVFGLPGNPGSSLATFERFVRPALRKMVGDPEWAPVETEAVLEGECGNPGDRTAFLRARLSWKAGALAARSLEGQGSGTLRSLGEANGFIVLPPGALRRGRGARVRVQVLSSVFGDVHPEGDPS